MGEEMEKAIRIAKVLAAEAVLSIIFLCLFALILQKLQPSESGIRMGVKILYVAVNLIGGLMAGKIMQQRRFLWGAVMGVSYFVLLSLVSFIVHGGFYVDIRHTAVVLMLCVAGGMAGGMIS